MKYKDFRMAADIFKCLLLLAIYLFLIFNK